MNFQLASNYQTYQRIKCDNAINKIVVSLFDRSTGGGHQAASISKTTIQFSGVKKKTQETEIRKYFENFGTVKKVKSKKGKGVVVFALPEEANEAMKMTSHFVGKSKLCDMKLT